MNSDDPTLPPAACRPTWDLLPWLANGSLQGEEKRRVETHLAGCERCQREAEVARSLGELWCADEAPAPKPHRRELDRLFSRIDQEEQFGTWRRLPEAFGGGWRRLAPGAPGFVRVALAAQLLLILGLVGWVVHLRAVPTSPSADFHTLSAAIQEPAAVHRVRIVFAEEVSEKNLRALLLPLEARIVDGPSPLGAYTLRVPADPPSSSPDLLLAHLRARPEVRFAEPLPAEAQP